MRLEDYNQREGKQVWLSSDELDQLIDEARSPQQKVALLLGGRSGLRREEIVSVTPNDFQHAPDGFLRVWEDYAKRSKYRETPVPSETRNIVETLAYDQPDDEAVVDVTGTTVYRWVRKAADQLKAATDDIGWSFLDVHDLRRTWGGDLLWNQGVLPSVVMAWGGWESWPTFREHYLGEMSPEAAVRERGKIAWMGGGQQVQQSGGPVFQPERTPSRGRSSRTSPSE
jgi:integrase